MVTVTFDTLKFAETLRDAGMPETRAKAILQAVRDTHERAELVTGPDLWESSTVIRADMQAMRTEIQSNVQSLRTEMQFDMQAWRAEVHDLEPRLTIRLGGIVVVALGAFTALSKWVAVASVERQPALRVAVRASDRTRL